ncbi:YciI family protein [uncultured Nitratireductor sp.]|uniref:YciI family protein n=1 Tax=uncultured Nitratireductor sp. TaxID=520953 RepID=UPI0025EE7CE0|nr:YciI family protein [uncultured Nitratireductor sp.]
MRYVCFVHVSEAVLDALPVAEMQKLVRDSSAYDEELTASGNMVVAHALHPTAEALYLRSRGGKVISVDGPYAETKEQLMGFILVEAESLERAREIAGRIPCAAYGSIELRAVAPDDA